MKILKFYILQSQKWYKLFEIYMMDRILLISVILNKIDNKIARNPKIKNIIIPHVHLTIIIIIILIAINSKQTITHDRQLIIIREI